MLQDLLGNLSDLLLWPTMALLLLLVVYTAFAAGAFAREALTRRRGAWLSTFAASVAGVGAAGLRERLDAVEARLARRVDRDGLVARLAPMLGLAGTLIPLGPALRELGHGDLGRFGEQLVVAFSTTVVGLFVCGVAYAMAAARSRWYEQDLRAMERLLPGGGDAV